MSLLGDIWDGIVSKVQSLISSALADFKYWVNARISDTIAGLKTIYNNVTTYLTNVYNNVSNYLTNVYNNVSNYLTNVYNNVSNYITNVTNSTSQYITNVVGASTEWVNNQLAGVRSYVDQAVAGVDTVGFFKDPLGYIGTAFTGFIDAWVHGVVGDLAEGIQAGLTEEEPGIHGAGESFRLGFLEAMNEKEGHVSRG